VPTLRDLLNPKEQRPVTFCRGYDVYDPIKVGFKEPEPSAIGPEGKPKDRYFLHDTRFRAEGNGGHLYGTKLSDDDKNKLLEYLKTL
jgi:hypothetical protein